MTTVPVNASGPSPWSMSWSAWKDVIVRSWNEASDDNIGLVAAGVAFYGFLALVPLLGAIVLSYGLLAEPSTVVHDMQALTAVMPAEAAKLIGEQLMNLVQTSSTKKGLGLLLALGIALFGARNGAGAIVTALNIAYEEKEKRGFLALNLLALAITGAAVGVALIAMIAIAALGHLEELLPKLSDAVAVLGKVGSYILLAGAAAAVAATLYRYGPSRAKVRWVWITPGSLFTAVLWLLLSLGFGAYAANFGKFEATYGSLATVVVLLTWIYFSVYILLFGAELNSEFEKVGQVGEAGVEAAPIDHDAVATNPVVQDGDDPPPGPDALTSPSGSAVWGTEVALRYASLRTAGHAGRLAGFGKIGVVSSGLAAFGLARIRHGSRPVQGFTLLAGAGALAWLRRDRSNPTGRVKALLVDLDGTLVDSNDSHVEAWFEAFRAYDHNVTRPAIRQQIGKGGDLLVPTLLPHSSNSQQKQVTDAHGEIFKSKYLHRVRPFPGATALLERAYQCHQRVVLASSASQAEVDHYVELLNASSFIYATTSIDDVPLSKPAPDIFQSAIDKAGVGASEAVVIGDTPYDIEAAHRLGVETIALRSGGFSDDQLAGAVLYDDAAALLDAFDDSPLGRG
ncbi:MAG: YihY family inner membrane protein [Sphingomonas sp.]|uniref:YhjD/YihY/BrkB family envelope integrity protein n=1 Tax=Sphingomonas sp. TaxID=28214 RepID=UPI001AC5E787|nr:YhjD/YihY/BrkB family envelope integrity protein [Sphingomonas sp.]MBN8808271.1 YihY family inner membrane protein [Sphingomonas sp.]